jgi:UDP-N-acetylmuramoyl-tripeptide--D-alanyl-D-alanine ligase
MIRALTLAELAERCGVLPPAEAVSFMSVTTDSRKLQKGDLFIALRGDNFDGHAFVDQIAKQGACAAVVEKKQASVLPQLVVDNTVHALGHLGAMNREQFHGPVIAITGSSGKTTVKQMIASILAVVTQDPAKVLATRGNLNNHIGVPQTLLEINRQHEYAVIEMGASAMGEIGYLAKMSQPQVSVINNVGTAHVGGFGSVDNIASGKGEIYQYLDRKGVAVINADDKYSAQWLKQTAAFRQITFSVNPSSVNREADVTAKNISHNNAGCFSFDLIYKKDQCAVQLPIIGEHNIANALAAAACCLALNIDLDAIKRGLEKVVNVAGRMQIKKGINNSCLIDDTYNANPASVRAAIDALCGMEGTRLLILGDMAELGEQSDALHREMGVYARQKGIPRLFTVGKASIVAAQAFGDGAQHFVKKDAVINACKHLVQKNFIVLVKGSRSSGMEDVVNGLLVEGTSAC